MQHAAYVDCEATYLVSADMLLHVSAVYDQHAAAAGVRSTGSRKEQQQRTACAAPQRNEVIDLLDDDDLPMMLGRQHHGCQARVLEAGHRPGLPRMRRRLTARPGGQCCLTSCLSRPSEMAATPGAPPKVNSKLIEKLE